MPLPSSNIYRVLGTTDEVTNCDRCGKPELKSTVIMGILDADGNVEEVVYMGSTCAARKARALGAGSNVTAAHIRMQATGAMYRAGLAVDWATRVLSVYGPASDDLDALGELYYEHNRIACDNHGTGQLQRMLDAHHMVEEARDVIARKGIVTTGRWSK